MPEPDIDNLKEFAVETPTGKWTAFGSPEELSSIPETHKHQIIFIDTLATNFLWYLCNRTFLLGEITRNPFARSGLKTVSQTFVNGDERVVKKWLYNSGIAFKTEVYLLSELNNFSVITTWKMIIKYCESIFFAHDVVVFDHTLNWCLFYYHDGELYLGKK